MLENKFVFTIRCERINREKRYQLFFPYQEQVVSFIKEADEKERRYNSFNKCWEITTSALYDLILKYKGSNKIYFDFGDGKDDFKKQLDKIIDDREQLKKALEDLERKKIFYDKYKKDLEINFKNYIELTHKNLKPNIKLYPHQIVATMFLNEAKNALLALDMGTGKSLSSIAYVEMNNFEKVFVITPNSLKFNYYGEVEKFTNSKAYVVNAKKNKYTIEESKYVIVNYEFFNKSNKDSMDTKFKKLGINKIDCFIADECFTYDTLINTDQGKIKIGEIVEKKLNVKVISYNHKLKKIERKTIKRYLYRGLKNVIKIKFSDNTILECTPDHKFYSLDRNKYIPIKDFQYGEKVIKNSETEMSLVQDSISNKRKHHKKMLFNQLCSKTQMGIKRYISNREKELSSMQRNFQTKKKGTEILFTKMCSEIYWKIKFEKSINNTRKKWKSSGTRGKALPILWRRFFCKKNTPTKILFPKLCRKMVYESTRKKRKNTQQEYIQKNFCITEENIKRTPRIEKWGFKENEDRKPYVQPQKHRKDEKHEKKEWWSHFFISWRERKINKATKKNIQYINWFYGFICGNGILHTNKNPFKRNECEGSITTNTLQSGYRDTRFKIINRSRWKDTQLKKMEIFRQKENRDTSIVWVESIEILESRSGREFGKGNFGNKKVYDLEIEDNHNYFANNILVSNCQKIASSKSNTTKNIKRIFKDKIFRDKKVSKVFMSGTPAPSKVYQLYVVLNQISPLEFKTKKHFYEYYCGMIYNFNGYGWEENNKGRLEELFHKLSPFTYRKKKEDVLTDLPDKTYEKLTLQMSNKEEAIYNDLEDGVANEFLNENLMNQLTIMLRLRQFTSSIKVKEIKEIIDILLAEGEKVIIVDMFKETLYELHKLYPEISAIHTGDQSVDERREIVNKFQDENSNLRLFLGSIQTCNYGLTLTASSKLFILTPPYTVGEYDQVADRLYRIGQKNNVTIYLPVFKDTIDEYVYNIIDTKKKDIVKVMDNENYVSEVTSSSVSEVKDMILRKHKKI